MSTEGGVEGSWDARSVNALLPAVKRGKVDSLVSHSFKTVFREETEITSMNDGRRVVFSN